MDTGTKLQEDPKTPFYGVFFSLARITPERVIAASARYMQEFLKAPQRIIVAPDRAEEARAAIVEANAALELQICGGILGGEFWLGADL